MTRQGRYRQRRRDGTIVCRVEVDEDRTIRALLDAHWLTEREALKRANVEAALAEIIRDWSRHWLRE